jgi:hypothetical protein
MSGRTVATKIDVICPITAVSSYMVKVFIPGLTRAKGAEGLRPIWLLVAFIARDEIVGILLVPRSKQIERHFVKGLRLNANFFVRVRYAIPLCWIDFADPHAGPYLLAVCSRTELFDDDDFVLTGLVTAILITIPILHTCNL